MRVSTGVCVLFATAVPAAGQSVSDIPRNELPKAAPCVACESNGAGHADEKAVAGVLYKGKAYYFCAPGEVAEFKKDPEAFIPLPLPRPVSAIAAKSVDGTSFSLDSWKGKVVLVDFWATWCAPCVKALPELQKLHTRFANRGFSVLGVSIDELPIAEVAKFSEKRKVAYPVVVDTGKTWKVWRVRAIPAAFLIDRAGNVVRQWTGKADFKEIEKVVEALLR